MKRALITGVSGQDGSFLAEFLAAKGYEVFGICRSRKGISSIINNCCTQIFEVDLQQEGIIRNIIGDTNPDEIYHLAAHHFSSQHDGNSSNSFIPFNKINLVVANDVLEVIARNLKACRFFYASSCQVFGNVNAYPQNENTDYKPNSFYGIAKAAAAQLCKFYREKEGVYASVGTLYNHESARRGDEFITSQIAEAAANAYKGVNVTLNVRDLDAIVDWGAASDYVEAMWLTLQQDESSEYIIASGIPRQVREFAETAFNVVGLNYKNFVFQAGGVVKSVKKPFVGDPSKIKALCRWHPAISFNELVKSMVQSKIDLHQT